MIIIHNSKTGEIIEREMNAKEIEQAKKDAEIQSIRKAETQAILTKREVAEAKLVALGLTLDDLRALGL